MYKDIYQGQGHYEHGYGHIKTNTIYIFDINVNILSTVNKRAVIFSAVPDQMLKGTQTNTTILSFIPFYDNVHLSRIISVLPLWLLLLCSLRLFFFFPLSSEHILTIIDFYTIVQKMSQP